MPSRTSAGRSPGDSTAIRQEFQRSAEAYGAIPGASPAFGQADPAQAPAHDLLGPPRADPDLGAYEWNSGLTIKDGFQGVGN